MKKRKKRSTSSTSSNEERVSQEQKRTRGSRRVVSNSQSDVDAADSEVFEVFVEDQEVNKGNSQDIDSCQTHLPESMANEDEKKCAEDNDARMIDLMLKNMGRFMSTEGAQEAIKTATSESLKQIEGRLDTLEEKCQTLEGTSNSHTTRQDELAKAQGRLEEEIDNLKQAQRNKMLRISGVLEEKEENIIDKVVDISRQKMKMNIQRSAIDSAWRLGAPGQVPRQVMVRFKEEATKREFYRKRISLKNCTPMIFINEDLTPRRAEIAMTARKLMKEKKLNNTWTVDGNIFIKKGPESKPKKVLRLGDLLIKKDAEAPAEPEIAETQMDAVEGSSENNGQWQF